MDKKPVYTLGETTVHESGLVDAMGRTIGCYVRTWSYVVVEAEHGGWALGDVEIGAVRFGFYAGATRNGSQYGSGSPAGSCIHFTVEAERNASVAAFLKGAASRAKKAQAGSVKAVAARAARKAAK